MAPPKQPAAGMRSISSFFAPKAKAPPKEQLPGIANGAIAPDPSESPSQSPPSADAHGATRAAKSAKTSACAAPGSATLGGGDGNTPPAAPSTAVSNDEQHARIDPSPRASARAESPPGDAPATATTANGAAGDVGRRIAVLWKSERRYFAGNVAAYDAANGKHHVRYDDGDDEWIALAKHDVKWDADAEAEAKKKAAPVDDDDDDDDDEDDDDDDDESDEAPPRTKRGRVTARRAAAAKALRRVGSKKSGERGGGRPARRAAGAKRKVVLSDSDDDFDAGGDEDASEGGDESESEFEVESEESEDDDDDDASEEESEEEESPGPKGKRGGAKSKPAQPAKKATPAKAKKATPAKARNPPSSSGGKSLAAALSEPVLAPTGSPELNPAHYEARERLMFPWLQPDKRRDASGRRPSDPEYDPTTLQLPGTFPKCKDATGKPFTVSPGQAQWWRFKAAHFDSVIMFKMGKFYELFEMDAHVGAADLGLQYMKGEQPHCGFPEKNYAANAERLARAGHRVVVVEQTETPAQLAERKARDKSVKDNVVTREKVAVLTRGTLVDTGMTDASPDATYCVAILEVEDKTSRDKTAENRAPKPDGTDQPDDETGGTWMGVCAADCATGRFLLGAWREDAFAGGLRGALAALKPVEIVCAPGGVGARVMPALRDATPDASIRSLSAASASLLHPDVVVERLTGAEGYFEDGALPEALATFGASTVRGERAAAIGAFGVMTAYLADAMIDRDLIPLGRVEAIPGPDAAGIEAARGGFVSLDAAALVGLEVLEGSDGGCVGSLLDALDRCAGAMGRRLLRRWVCRPLRSAAAVAARQAAVREMRSEKDAVAEARRALRSSPDLERAASRLVGQSGGRGRDAANVVLYEDAARARLHGFLRALEGVRGVLRAVRAFDGVRSRLTSPALLAIVTEGDTRDADARAWADERRVGGVRGASTPELSERLAFFERAFDWDKARESGRIEPKPGADEAVDAADDRVCAADEALREWLVGTRKKLGGSERNVNLVSANKDTHLCEVSDELAGKVPADWSREGKRKGFEKFDCPELKALRAEREAAGEARELALENVLRALVAKFCDDWPRWRRAAEAAAALDALSSLAEHADEIAGSFPESCTPSVMAPERAGGGPSLDAVRLRHPCAPALASGESFVPNDTKLGGGGDAPFLLLTGPNMGGKSTLIRQVCLAAIMAHVGADVPAASFSMTAADAIFVRMGAKDNIIAGQSTFMTELAETSAMLRRATSHSLVAMDELGRGTSTSDGAAIASAVSDHLVDLGARTMFSTHYHRLADDWANDARVRLGHMGCDVRGESGAEEVTFLYKLTEGSCPKSYGVNVARLAGLPEDVVQAAAKASKEMEEAMNARAVMRAVQAVRDAMDEFERTEDVSVLIAAQQRARRVLAHVKDPVKEAKE